MVCLMARILRSKIFIHSDGQLQVAHVILEFTPISTLFQAPNHSIKARYLGLALIDVLVKGFITPPPLGTLQVKPCAHQLINSIHAEGEEEQNQTLDEEEQSQSEIDEENAFERTVSEDFTGDFSIFTLPDFAIVCSSSFQEEGPLL